MGTLPSRGIPPSLTTSPVIDPTLCIHFTRLAFFRWRTLQLADLGSYCRRCYWQCPPSFPPIPPSSPRGLRRGRPLKDVQLGESWLRPALTIPERIRRMRLHIEALAERFRSIVRRPSRNRIHCAGQGWERVRRLGVWCSMWEYGEAVNVYNKEPCCSTYVLLLLSYITSA